MSQDGYQHPEMTRASFILDAIYAEQARRYQVNMAQRFIGGWLKAKQEEQRDAKAKQPRR